MLKRLSALSLPLLISFWGGCFEETFDLTEAADLTDPRNITRAKYSLNTQKLGDFSR